MLINNYDITYSQEVPNKITLVFAVCGCPRRCPGCHSQHLQNTEGCYELTVFDFIALTKKYSGLIDAIVFLGGTEEEVLEMTMHSELPVCYYTGADVVHNEELTEQLMWLKVGSWQGIPVFEEGSNQVFYTKENGEWKIS
jgi:anaerobic ribonucleoside-triphosphate reductase activating protein